MMMLTKKIKVEAQFKTQVDKVIKWEIITKAKKM